MPGLVAATNLLAFLAVKNSFLKILTCGLLLNSSWHLSLVFAKKKMSKIFLRGSGGSKKNFFSKKKIFFFKSCSESSETNFGILKFTFAIFAPGGQIG